MRKWLAIAVVLIAQSAWGSDTITANVATDHGQVPLTLELATTPSTREYGLMNRTTLAPNDGMLFVFPHTARIAFWMKNTKIPLDMLFIDEKGVIQHIATNATPESLTPIDSVKPTKSVIEVAGGRTEHDKIHKGDRVDYTLPAGAHVQ